MIQNCLKRNRKTAVLYLFGVILLILFNHSPLYAQATLGARPVALGQASTALPGSPWSVFENVAMISEQQPEVSFFGMRYYGLSELSDIAAVITYPTPFGVI
jgi:hypothetical protein